MIGAAVSTLIAVVGAFILVQFVGFDDPAEEENSQDESEISASAPAESLPTVEGNRRRRRNRKPAERYSGSVK